MTTQPEVRVYEDDAGTIYLHAAEGATVYISPQDGSPAWVECAYVQQHPDGDANNWRPELQLSANTVDVEQMELDSDVELIAVYQDYLIDPLYSNWEQTRLGVAGRRYLKIPHQSSTDLADLVKALETVNRVQEKLNQEAGQ